MLGFVLVAEAGEFEDLLAGFHAARGFPVEIAEPFSHGVRAGMAAD